MACEPGLRRTGVPRHDPTFQPLPAKRRIPDSFCNHIQELPQKARKTEAKSTTVTSNHANLRYASACLQDAATYQHDVSSQQNQVVRVPKLDNESQVQLSLKVKYESSIRRFTVPASSSFKDLRLKLAKKMLEDKVMSIEYKDDEGHTVLLSSESDMAEFSRIVRDQGMNPVQLCVNLWPR